MMEQFLRQAVEALASDLHITVGMPPVARVNGQLIKLSGQTLSAKDTDELFRSISTPEQQERFRTMGEVDFSFALQGLCRFRVNAFKQRGSTAIAIRVVNEQLLSLEQLGFPDIVEKLALSSRGLILVTGPTGHGKSTTLAAMVNFINTERSCHIITLEDPIEFLHKHKKAIVNQREILNDSRSYANALRAVLREDPDVILIGELRDAETIGIAVTAAETGHLVLATLHTGDAPQTIDRIIDVFPPYQQQQVRVQLSLTLQGVISQQLIPKVDGSSRVAALEILVVTPAIRNLIREGKTHQIASSLQTGSRFGMQTMDQALADLYKRGLITIEDAMVRSSNQEALMRLATR